MIKIPRKLIIKISFLAVFLVVFCVIYFKFNNNEFKVRPEKYSNYIGYINPETAFLNNKDSLCGDKKIIGTHHGLPEYAFKISKKHFRNTVISTYKNNNYSDSGYLNLRFLVNCKGVAGWFEIIEMNLDLEETNLNDAMVNQLLDVTSNYKFWSGLYSSEDKPLNYYMYVSYRIENGNVVEVLP